MAIAFSAWSATAQSDDRLVVNVGSIDQVNIGTDMNIVLVPGTSTDQSVSLNAAASGRLDMKLSGSSLTIASSKHTASKERLTVYLYLNNLKTITVENNSHVKTIGVLDAPKVDVFIDGDATVHLKTNGEVKAHSLGEAEVEIKYLFETPLAKR